MLVPPGPIVKRFDETMNAMRCALHASEQQSSTVASLRDALLPKLLSGELRVCEAGKLVEAAL